MKYINNEELQRLHEVQIEILKEVSSFCKKNDITYFLVGGTLLGAIRHKGFIPWDDDIDIGMLRDDYEKFLKLFPHDKTSKYYVQALEIDKNYWNCFAKVRKSNTLVLEEKIKNLDLNKEINIDIFPFDYVASADYNKIKIRAGFIRILRDSIHLKRHIKSNNDCHHKILSRILTIFSVQTLYKIQLKLMTKDKKQDSQNIACYVGDYNVEKEFNLIDVFLPLKKGEFEKLEFNIPNKPQIYLEKIYGNYMELPPVEKRVTHGIIKIDTEKGEYNE